jgi:hypothetical protein
VPLFLSETMSNPIYHLNVQYRWSFRRGNATMHHYRDDYAISQYNTLEEINLDNVNYAISIKRLGLLGKKIINFQVVKIYDFKIVGQTNE